MEDYNSYPWNNPKPEIKIGSIKEICNPYKDEKYPPSLNEKLKRNRFEKSDNAGVDSARLNIINKIEKIKEIKKVYFYLLILFNFYKQEPSELEKNFNQKTKLLPLPNNYNDDVQIKHLERIVTLFKKSENEKEN